MLPRVLPPRDSQDQHFHGIILHPEKLGRFSVCL